MELCSNVRKAGMLSFGKKRTRNATHSWSKSNEVTAAFHSLVEAEAELLADPTGIAAHDKLQESKKEFHSIRAEKEKQLWNQVNNKMSCNQTSKLLHLLLPQESKNINLLDIQHPTSSTPCNSKAEAAEVLVDHYAQVCSLPDSPAFSSSNKTKIELFINSQTKSTTGSSSNTKASLVIESLQQR
jgi:hypothetical protein